MKPECLQQAGALFVGTAFDVRVSQREGQPPRSQSEIDGMSGFAGTRCARLLVSCCATARI